MIFTSAFTVYTLGLRHGADPDHLAAIDSMTRNSIGRSPRLSRLIGTLFAGGHSIMVLAIAAIVGFVGARMTAYGALIETAGTWVSIAVLLAMALLNIRQLRAGTNDRIAGLKTRLLPSAIARSATPWIAIPAGMLFGVGFETSSQVATYAIAFGADAGLAGALTVGGMFCAGMACTDTLDSLFVHYLVSYRSGRMPSLMRPWIIAVTGFAVAVAAYELACVLGYKPPVSDLAVSLVLAGSLIAVFVGVILTTRRSARVTSHMEHVV